MLKRKSVQALMLSAAVIMMIYLLAAAISLTTQKPIDKREAKPAGLPGIQVTVVNKAIPNATPKSVTTDKEGSFDLGVLPAGTYVMSFRLPDDAGNTSRNTDVYIKQSGVARSANPTLVKVTVEGTTEGTMVRGWDPKTKKAVDLTETTQYKGEARMKPQDKLSPQLRKAEPGAKASPDIIFTTDGKQRVKGAAHDASMSAIQNMK
jgi:hypothetical protein